MFSCELCEISINTIFTEHLWTTASELSYKQQLFKLKQITKEKDLEFNTLTTNTLVI